MKRHSSWDEIERAASLEAEKADDTTAQQQPEGQKEEEKVAVFGAGSFGTALAYVLAKKGLPVVILCRDEDQAKAITLEHRNPKYFTEFLLPTTLTATTDAKEALQAAKWVVHAVPVQQTTAFLSPLADMIPPTLPIISASKGIHTESHELMCQIIPKALGRHDQAMGFLGGPTFAKEMMLNMPTAACIASTDPELCARAQALFSSTTFRVYTSSDIRGVELGGALKNVIAIAAGCAQGLGMGNNSVAALVTRGVSEMRKLATSLGAQPETLNGLSGVGDLMLTCFGSLSRNQTVGRRLGGGETLEEILATMPEVAEGVPTATAVKAIVEQHGLYLPIMSTVHDVLHGIKPVKLAVQYLMTRPLKEED